MFVFKSGPKETSFRDLLVFSDAAIASPASFARRTILKAAVVQL